MKHIFTRGPKQALYLGLALSLIETAAPLMLTMAMQQIIDAVVTQNFSAMRGWMLVSATTLALGGLAMLGAFMFSAHFVNRQIGGWRENIGLALATAPFRSISQLSSADVMSRVGYDIDTAGQMLWGVVREFWKPLVLIAAVGFVLVMSWKLLLAAVVLIPPLTWLSNRVTLPLGQAAKQKAELIAAKSELYREVLQSNASFKVDGLQPYFIEKIGNVLLALKETLLTMDRRDALHGMVFLGLRYPPQLIVPIYGGYLAFTGEISPGALVACYFIIAQIFVPVETVLGWVRQWRTAKPSAERIGELLQWLDSSAHQRNATTVHTIHPAISTLRIDDLTFAYDGRAHTLAHVAFELSAGVITLLTGHSGSGKSTLIRILSGLEQPKQGLIRLDNLILSSESSHVLQALTALVPQEAFLFPMSIRENIRLGRLGASDAEVIQAAIGANAHTFILTLPNGYETQIDPRGTNLSGGQKQRICLARAILKDAPILLLDEPTAALDEESEALIHASLTLLAASRHKIILIVSHRPATVEIADQFLHLNKGSIDEVSRNQLRILLSQSTAQS